MKMTVFLDVALCSLVEIDRHFRGASETVIFIFDRRENLKSHCVLVSSYCLFVWEGRMQTSLPYKKYIFVHPVGTGSFPGGKAVGT
jgi:hypothetical protein